MDAHSNIAMLLFKKKKEIKSVSLVEFENKEKKRAHQASITNLFPPFNLNVFGQPHGAQTWHRDTMHCNYENN